VAHTTVPTKAANDDITASLWNTYIRDNDSYHFNGRPKSALLREGSADYTISSTSFVDVDAANLILTVTINSGIALVEFSCTATPPGSTSLCCFDIILDSTTRAGGTNGLLMFDPGGTPRQVYVAHLFTGLSVGSHTFKLQARSTAGNSLTIHNNPEPIWGRAREAA